jgi:hypothetical protein
MLKSVTYGLPDYKSICCLFVNGINPAILSIHKIEIVTEFTLYYLHGRFWIQ